MKWTVAVLLVLAACGDDSSTPDAAIFTKSCGQVCDQVALCNPNLDRPLCASDCERSRKLLQASLMQALALCSERPCGQQGDSCRADAQKQCQPLATVGTVADSYCAKQKQCEPATDLVTCKAQLAPTLACFAQAGLDKVSSCIASSGCGTFSTCMKI